jgi:glycerate kinase
VKIVLAFDSWKGSLTAAQACTAATVGLRRLSPVPDIISCPLSDGGEGFLDAIAIATAGVTRSYPVTGPMGNPVMAPILFLQDGNVAVIESASVCGLHLVPPSFRNPGRIRTTGLGELVNHAVAAGAREIILGLGGSASNDAGIGFLSALGWCFSDAEGRPVDPCGDSLVRVSSITAPSRPFPAALTAACDVINPLYGPTGAAFVYAPQKGASPADVLSLDAGLHQFADRCATALGEDLSGRAGAGAAGGLGFALLAFLNARFRPGAELAIEQSGLRKHLDQADLCLTGEGQTDSQTASGKLPAAVGAICRENRIPCVCLSGSLGAGARAVYESGITSVLSVIQTTGTLEDAIRVTPRALADTAEAIGRLVAHASTR